MSKKHTQTQHKQQRKETPHHNKAAAPEEDQATGMEMSGKVGDIDWKNIFSPQKLKKIFLNEKVLIILLLLIAIGLSTHFRMFTSDLPVTEDWATSSYENQIRSQVAAQINAQFPNLPAEQKNQEINKQTQIILEQQWDEIAPQIKATSNFFKSQLQDDNGNTYLLAIDPYVWHSQAKNMEAYGMAGDEIVDGKPSFSLRNGREAKFDSFNLHPYLGTVVHKIGSVFNKDFTLQRAIFLLPVFIIALAIIVGFFFARKIGGNVAGFVTSMTIALNTALLGRTPAGFSDTDAYLIFFPLLIFWTFFEAMTAKTWKKKALWSIGAGVAALGFKYTWGNWWHAGSILAGVAGIYFIYSLVREYTVHKDKKRRFIQSPAGKTLAISLIFLISLTILNVVFGLGNGATTVGQDIITPTKDILFRPLSALGVKGVATADIWPNVLTTVAELNEGSWGQIINSIGGELFFWLAVLGILATFLLRTEDDSIEIRHASLVGIWFFGLTIVSLMSARFIALLAAPFAIAFGALFGILWSRGAKLLKKHAELPLLVTRIALVLIIIIMFIGPISDAKKVALSEVPSMNDGWYNSLISIKEDSQDAIITSWWDFGHWFVNIAERRVTFDGGNQGRRIHWVGRSLMTEDVQENKAILRMLNCGQNLGYERLLEYTGDRYTAVNLVYDIYMEDRETAQSILEDAGLSDEQVSKVLEKTHCSDEELLDQYYIASQDMIGKAGVWAHFGSWDFDRAYIYNLAANNDYDTAINLMQERVGLSENEATDLYYQATALENNRAVDSWVSPWPNYVMSKATSCTLANETFTCNLNQGIGSQNGQDIRMETLTVPVEEPKETTITIGIYANGARIGEDRLIPQKVSIGLDGEEFITTEIENPTLGYEVAIAQTGNNTYKVNIADDMLATSSFSRLFFFEGYGMEGYEVLSDVTDFTGQRILVYKVDLRNDN